MLGIANNAEIARKLSQTIRHDVRDQDLHAIKETFIEKIAWIFELLVSNKAGVDKLTYHRSLLMLMEAGIFLTLLRKVDSFSNPNDENGYHRIVMSIEKFIGINLQGTNLYERSIYYKSKIFENISIIVSAAEKVEGWRTFLVPTFLIYTSFVRIFGVAYCRSVIRCHIKDGTVLKMARLLSQHGQDGVVIKLLSLHCPELFFQLMEVDVNTYYNKPCNDIVDVLREIVPIMTKILLLNWKAQPKNGKKAMRALKIIEHYVTVCDDKVDQRILKRIKLGKNLLDLISSGVRSCKDVAELTWLLNQSSIVLRKINDVKAEDLRPIIPFLIKSMRKVSDKMDPSGESYFLACAKFSLLIVKKCDVNDAKFIDELLRMKFIPAKIHVIQYYSKSSVRTNLVLIALIIGSMGELVEKAAIKNLLELIDQVLVCFPILVQYITERRDLNLEVELMPGFSLASELGMFLVTVVSRITSDIFDNRVACVKPQLKAILDSDLVLAAGLAIITFKNHDTLMYYIKIFAELVHVVDNRKIMKTLVVLLPEIVETAAELLKSYSEARDKENIYHQMLPIVRKSLAYAIADVDPNVLGRNDGEIMRVILSFWASVKVTDVGMEYPVLCTFELNKGECYFDGDAIADVLRGTWQLFMYYPVNALEIFIEVMPDSTMFLNCSENTEKVKMIKKFVLDFVSSYIDRSEEYSTEFLLHITAFIRDLSIDRKDEICLKLFKACKSFLRSQKHTGLVYNVSRFINGSQDSLADIGFNRCSICDSKGLDCYF